VKRRRGRDRKRKREEGREEREGGSGSRGSRGCEKEREGWKEEGKGKRYYLSNR
jgi:hypothetical protein